MTPVVNIFGKLALAATLGAVVGLERDFHRKPAGMRTTLFICMGSALFTVLSLEIGRAYGDPSITRIVSNLIPGIGFLGAGAILRERGAVTGLTTAATIFVMAGVGMAVGAGLYRVALFTVGIILFALVVLGWLENRLNIKSRLMLFRLTTRTLDSVLAEVNRILSEVRVTMQHFQVFHVGEDFMIEFEAEASHYQQQKICGEISRLGSKCEIVPLDAPKE